jgi:hydroxypyruvate reductase
MARAFEKAWAEAGNGPIEGLVVTRYGHAVACEHIEIVEAAHPVPDAAGEAAARRMIEMVKGLMPDDLVVALISGGGSALLSLPADGLTLSDKQAINRQLLKSGADIGEMNCVRKHLSAIKGGRLAAAAAPAKVYTLLISDVPGDDPGVIASGPTQPDATTFADARNILARYGITEPANVIRHLEAAVDETPKPGDPCFEATETRMIATPQMSLEAAAKLARDHGYTPLILSDCIEGEARDVARVMAGIARQVVAHGQPVAAPCVILSGGETTVTVRGSGRGGRNVEFLLALGVALNGLERVFAVAGDTDGVDGLEEIAGGILSPASLARAAALGLNPAAMLDNNDGHSFFEALGDQLITGPTLTNVNDFRAILIEAPRAT